MKTISATASMFTKWVFIVLIGFAVLLTISNSSLALEKPCTHAACVCEFQNEDFMWGCKAVWDPTWFPLNQGETPADTCKRVCPNTHITCNSQCVKLAP